MKPTVVAAALLFFVSGSVVAQGLANIRYMAGGRERVEEGVTVTDETFSKVNARKGAARIAIDPADIIALEYQRGPAAFSNGKTAFDDGDYEKAVGLLQTALEANSSEAWVKIYTHWFLGQALARAGQMNEAVAALNEVPKIQRDHRLVPLAYALLGELHSRRGAQGADDARKALEALRGLKLGGRWDLEVELGFARIDLVAGQPDAALERLAKIENAASTAPTLAQLIRLEKGNALVKKGQFAEAEAAFRMILESAGDISPEVRAGACNGLGDCQMALKKWEEAFKSYSRTFVWFKDDSTLRNAVGWALFQAGKAMSEWATSLQGEARATMTSRSTRLWRIAARDYAGTTGARLAREALGL